MENYKLLKEITRSRIFDQNNKELALKWKDMKAFCETLTEDQLDQNIIVWGEERSDKIISISITIDEGINPSGDGIEPRMLYSKSSDKQDRIIAHEAPTIIPKGIIILESIAGY